MKYTDREVLQFIAENDVKFVRLAFLEPFGALKNIAIMADELPAAFEYGVAFDAERVDGFVAAHAGMLLRPEASTLEVLPWRPQTGRVARLYCSITLADGTPFEGDSRSILRNAIDRLQAAGYSAQIGCESDFYLMRLDDNGDATITPHDKAGYADVAPMDKCENVRRDICLTLEQMGIRPLSSHHESGPGQNCIAIAADDPMRAADHCVTLRNLVCAIATRGGLDANMQPLPLYGCAGSTFMISLCIMQGGRNLFGGSNGEISAEGSAFLAGIIHHLPDITAFLNSTPTSYARLSAAPMGVGWDRSGRAMALRLPAISGGDARVHLLSADNQCNPYIAYALILLAGLDGIENNRPLPPQDTAKAHMPRTLEEALVISGASDLVASALPGDVLSAFLRGRGR